MPELTRPKDFKDRLDLIEHLLSQTYCAEKDLLQLILEELRVLRGRTQESERLIRAIREATR